MPTKVNTDKTDSGVASGALAANTLVKWHTVAGQLANTGVGDIPIGSIQEAIASGATGVFFRSKGTHLVTAGAGVTAGDYLKTAAAGKLVPEATPTTPTAMTVGQAKEAASGDGVAFMAELY